MAGGTEHWDVQHHMGYTWEEMEETEEEDLNHLARVVAEAWKASGPDADTSEEEESEEDADEL